MGALEVGRTADRPDPSQSQRFFEGFHSEFSGAEESTVLYSGGLDSSLVAFCASHRGGRIRLLSVGTSDSPDRSAAESGARRLGLPHAHRLLRTQEVRRAAESARGELEGAQGPDRAVRVSLILALDAVETRRVWCGQGADELFGGYAHFRGLEPDAANRRRREDLAHLEEDEWPWALEAARRRGLILGTPFLTPAVREVALTLRAAQWCTPTRPKGWLRDLARVHGLPPELAERPKRAFQYGSRVHRELVRGDEVSGDQREPVGPSVRPDPGPRLAGDGATEGGDVRYHEP